MYTILWGVLLILCIIVEIMTVDLISIWFCLGSLGGLIASAIGAPLPVQIIIFFTISLISIFMVKPLAKKHMKYEKTNVDSIIGKKTYVTEEISNIDNTGEILLNGITWKAKSIDNTKIDKNSLIEVVKIEGVTAFVNKISNQIIQTKTSE